MNTTLLRVTGSGLLFLLIFLSGFWLSRSGKPYPAIVFNIHKLIALGTVIFLGVTVSRIHPGAPLGIMQVIAIAVTLLCFLINILTGGLLSIDKTMPEIVHRLHEVTPYLIVLSSAISLYLLLSSSQDTAALLPS
jgi:hypothetical protein